MDITTFIDPLLALNDLKSHDYVMIITDIRMQKMSDLELYREVRKYNDHTTFCFLSAFEIFQKEFSTMFPEVDAKVFPRKPVKSSVHI